MILSMASAFAWSGKRGQPKAPTVVLTCVMGFAGCTAGPDFTRPAPPPATRYTADALNVENARASDTAQHIDLGREVEGAWWTLFGSDTIDQLVKRAVEHNRSLEAATGTLSKRSNSPWRRRVQSIRK